jgi:MFS transporter, DHA2 family, multidrug resistance protein
MARRTLATETPPSLGRVDDERGPARLAIVGVALTTLSQSLDAKMLGPVLPLMRGDLALTIDESSWIAIVYLMANFAVLPLSPWLVERFGRRRVVLACLAGFVLGALLSAIAVGAPMLLVARVIQGAFGGGLISTSHAVLREMFPDSKIGAGQLVFAGSFIGAPSALGPLIGGAFFDTQTSWRWMFVVEALIAVTAFALCRNWLPERKPTRDRAPFDTIGFTLLAIALVPLQYVLFQGERYDWFNDAVISSLVALTVCAFVAFVIWEARMKGSPLIDVRYISRRPILIAGAVLMVPVGLCLVAIVSVIADFVQRLLGFTATQAGELVFLRALVFMPFALAFGVIMDRRRPPARVLVMIGLALLAIAGSMQAFTTTTQADFTAVVVPLIIGGIAIGPLFVPLLWVLFRSVPRATVETLRVATSIDLALQLGSAGTSALIPSIVDHRFAFHFDVIRSELTQPRLTPIGLPMHTNVVGLLTSLATQQSYALAFADAALVIGVVALAALPIALLLRQPARGDATR